MQPPKEKMQDYKFQFNLGGNGVTQLQTQMIKKTKQI